MLLRAKRVIALTRQEPNVLERAQKSTISDTSQDSKDEILTEELKWQKKMKL